jgi:3-methyladenine DNA glycosylase/8-oxoguanine DNA glycosylase
MRSQPHDLSPGLAWLREADPVLAKVIGEHPAFDPSAWLQRLPTLDLFGALVFQVIGQQISVVAATAIFARLVEHFDGRAPEPDDLVGLGPETLRGLGLSRRRQTPCSSSHGVSSTAGYPRPSSAVSPMTRRSDN